MKRPSGRENDEIRPLKFALGISHPSQLSVMTRLGHTSVLCGVSITNSVPPFLRGTQKGWLTSEYGMLPLSCEQRIHRDRQHVNGRTIEIQRLIGRSLRTMVDLSVIGERTLMVDCDVLVADGGTRTTAITGASAALHLLMRKLIRRNEVPDNALRFNIAALSIGIVDQAVLVDLDYAEDASCDADINVVMNDRKEFLEIQGTSEHAPMTQSHIGRVIEIAGARMEKVFEAQRAFIDEVGHA